MKNLKYFTKIAFMLFFGASLFLFNGCDSAGKGAYLYIVPPSQKIEYLPSSDNPFHNLTIYISDFPIITNEHSQRVTPAYTVDLTLRGYFMNSSGKTVETFIKKITFFPRNFIKKYL